MPEVKYVAEYVGQNLDKGLDKLQKEFAETSVAATKSAKAIEGTAPAMAKAAIAANKLDSSLQRGLKPGAAQAGNALQNLGRIAQDAPFGFIGISNNINPLLESFQRLKAETGSTGAALKALATGLIGGGGLGLAISVATGLLTVFSMSNRSAGDETKKTKEKVDLAAEAQKKFESDISSASQALIGQSKSLKDVQALLVSTSARYDDLTAATKRQAFAQYLFGQRSEEVKKILDGVIKQQLQQAKINNPFAGAGVREYSQDLFAASRYMEQVKNGTIRFSKAAYEAAKNAQAIAESAADLANLNILGKGFDDLFAAIADPQKTKAAIKEVDTISSVLRDLEAQLLFLSKRGIVFNVNEEKAKISAIKSTIEKLLKDFNVAPDDTIIAKLVGNIATLESRLRSPELQRAVSEAAKRLAERPITVPVIPRVPEGVIKKSVEDISEQYKQLAVGITDAIGSSIGEAFATGGKFLSNALSGILNIMGDFLIQLGKAAVLQSALIQAIKAANPIAGFAAGVAAIIAGNILKNIKIPKFATGGVSPGGGILVGERGPEIITPPRGSVITPNAQTNAILGNGGGRLIPEPVRIKGGDIYISWKYGQEQLGRKGQL